MGVFTDLVTRRRFLGISALVGGTLVLGGCESDAPRESSSTTTFDTSARPAPETSATSGDTPEQVDVAVSARVLRMTLPQKVAQLFVVAPEALVSDVAQVTQAGEMTHAGITDWPVGGIIYFAQNLVNPDQTKTMLGNVKQFYADDGNVAPLLAVDEEGGTVARVAGNEAFGVTDVGNAADLGRADSADAAKQAAEKIADYLVPLGFNLDFAPVCDVVDPLRSDTMGLRSFSSDANVAAAMAVAEVQGFLDRGMLCCAKHFPGIGAAAGDSHDGAITIDKTAEELEEVDLVPFKAVIKAEVPFIMVGHLDLPLIVAEEGVPSSLSSTVVQGMLRDKLGYTGVIVTDSLSMGAITERYTPAEAAVAALAAGCDILLMPANLREAYRGVLDALEAGELTEERLDESVTRILAAKQRCMDL